MRLPPRLHAFLRDTVRPIAVMLVVLFSFRSAVADWNVVPTGSMNPTILEGDRIWVNKLAYGLKVPFTTWHVARWSEPARGDVVVFFSPADGQRFVKRLVGVPGDTIEMIDNRLRLNGQPVEYEPIGEAALDGYPPERQQGHQFASEKLGGASHPVMATPAMPARRAFGPLTVPPGQYFVLGDNRDNSADSRYIGFVPRSSIVGRSSSVVLSLDPESHLPRWERTLKPLP